MQRFSLALALTCVLLVPAPASPQARPREPLLQQAVRVAPPLTPAAKLQPRAANQPPQGAQTRSVRKRIFGAIVGGVGGFFAGGYTGAWIEGDRCHCDDPGLKGALIGAPIGAAAGGILGGLYLF
jgi:hypothetical protein